MLPHKLRPASLAVGLAASTFPFCTLGSEKRVLACDLCSGESDCAAAVACPCCSEGKLLYAASTSSLKSGGTISRSSVGAVWARIPTVNETKITKAIGSILKG